MKITIILLGLLVCLSMSTSARDFKYLPNYGQGNSNNNNNGNNNNGSGNSNSTPASNNTNSNTIWSIFGNSIILGDTLEEKYNTSAAILIGFIEGYYRTAYRISNYTVGNFCLGNQSYTYFMQAVPVSTIFSSYA